MAKLVSRKRTHAKCTRRFREIPSAGHGLLPNSSCFCLSRVYHRLFQVYTTLITTLRCRRSVNVRDRSIIRPFLSHFWVHTFHLRLNIDLHVFLHLYLYLYLYLDLYLYLSWSQIHTHLMQIFLRAAQCHTCHGIVSAHAGNMGTSFIDTTDRVGCIHVPISQEIRNKIFLRMLKCAWVWINCALVVWFVESWSILDQFARHTLIRNTLLPKLLNQ